MFWLRVEKAQDPERITEQTKGRGKPSHDRSLESSILILTEPSLFQSRGWCVHPESRIELKRDEMDERQMGESSDTEEKAVEITPG